MDFTKTPIIIAVYENIDNIPNSNNLRMFSIEWIQENKLNIENFKNIGKCFQIPVKETFEGFELLERYR